MLQKNPQSNYVSRNKIKKKNKKKRRRVIIANNNRKFDVLKSSFFASQYFKR